MVRPQPVKFDRLGAHLEIVVVAVTVPRVDGGTGGTNTLEA
jgi:hypothetical protein